MTQQARQDESLLIDFLLGELDAEQAEQVRRRLETDESFRRRKEDLANTFAALDNTPEIAPPDDLVEATMARIESARRTSALLAMQQNQPQSSYRSTFSLRELAAVAAIILVIISVLIPSMRLAQHRSDRSLCAANIGRIGTAFRSYAANHAGVLPHADPNATRWLPGDGQPAASNSSALFKLIRQNYIDSPVAFQCPAVGGKSTVITDEMNDFPGAQYIHYSYQHALGEYRMSIHDPRLAPVVDKMVILADQTPLFVGGRFHADRVRNPVSHNHHEKGQNVLFLTGTVRWVEKPDVGVEEDNIFLIRDVYQYTGTEKPASLTDTFLLPSNPDGQ